MQEVLEMDVFAEAFELTRALRGHLELLSITGTDALPRAPARVGPSLEEPPASLAPTAAPRATAPRDVAAPSMPDWLAEATQAGKPQAGRSPGGMPAARPQTSAQTPSQSASAASQVLVPPGAQLTREARQQGLVALATQVSSCRNCGLCEKRTQTVFSRGTGSSGLCFVGEGPGADEDAQGYPFVGAAGQLLDKMIAAMGLGRDEVYVCNIVKCRPPENRKPLPAEMTACMPYLQAQLELLAPEVIVALGATAVEGLLGVSSGITRLRGTWKLYQGKIAVMPTFHPAYLLRSPSAKHVVWEDMKAVLKQLGRDVPERGRKPSA